MSSYACQRHHLHCAHHLTKASCEISARTLKDGLIKGKKTAKNEQIMPSYAN